jgi:putative colanic acid biosynthesis acetyltransferase WcaF
MLTIGNKVGIANGVTLYNMAPIEIGDYCVVSQGAHLCCGTHDYNSANFQLIARPIVLKPYVWVCTEAFLSPGVIISEGAVIGARSVVTKSLENPWSVYAGMPCREIGKRARTALD